MKNENVPLDRRARARVRGVGLKFVFFSKNGKKRVFFFFARIFSLSFE